MRIIIENNILLELISKKHAEGLFTAIDKNRTHLAEFLPWVNNMQSMAAMNNYIENCELLQSEKKEISFVILCNEVICGRIGLHHWNSQNNSAAIGYWLTQNLLGKGIITKACKALLHYGFSEMGLNRIEIKAATGNLRSQAIPEKLGFKKEGILRAADLVNGEYLDLVLFSLLANEYFN